MQDIMIDIETAGRKVYKRPAVLSIGACQFDRNTGEIGEQFYVNVSPTDSKELGFWFCPDTLQWWKEQPKQVVDALRVDPKSVEDAAYMFSSWMDKIPDSEIWVCGMDFDFPILESFLDMVGAPVPWGNSYWRKHDYRSILHIVDVNNSRLRKATAAEGEHHNALADAIAQAKILSSLIGEQHD